MAVTTSEKVADPQRPDTLFIQAQREYLGGHWEEAEAILKRRLEQAPRDIESGLLLTTLFRHMRRFNDAREGILAIERFDESSEWEFEIEREKQLIDLIESHELAEILDEPKPETIENALPASDDSDVECWQSKKTEAQPMASDPTDPI